MVLPFITALTFPISLLYSNQERSMILPAIQNKEGMSIVGPYIYGVGPRRLFYNHNSRGNRKCLVLNSLFNTYTFAARLFGIFY